MTEEAARASTAGGLMRSTREELGWNIRDVGAALRIRPDYLEALERNTVVGLPGPTYATGFLRAYAEYLGLDSAEIVRRFRSEKTGLHAKPELAFPVPLTDRGVPGGGFFLIALLLIGLIYCTWYYLSSGKHATPPAVDPVPTRLLDPPTLEPPTVHTGAPIQATPPQTTEPTSGAVEPAPASTIQVPPQTAVTSPPIVAPPAPPVADPNSIKPGGRVFGDAGAHSRIMVRALADAWVTVKDGERPVLNRLLKKGDVYYPEKSGLVLRTGNAGALQVVVDGKPLAPIGEIGHVRTLQLEPNKLLNSAPGG